MNRKFRRISGYIQPGHFGEKYFLLPGIEALDSPVHGLVTMLTELPWLQT